MYRYSMSKLNKTRKRKVVKGGSFGYEEKNKIKLCRDLADIFEQLHGDKIHINNSHYGNSINEYDHEGKPTYNGLLQFTKVTRKELEKQTNLTEKN